jgi:hypothetical protein
MDSMSEIKFGTWTAPESPVDIEYSLVVIDEIRQAVTEGFQRLSRGGIEVGGVLYGSFEGRTVRIAALREIACEHARGPTFLLSDNDRALLTAQLERDREDPRLEGMTAVGWFLSHTRSEITLQKGDLETYDLFFPAPWQVTLVVRPGRAGIVRAGFFVRESDGAMKTDRSYLDFVFPDRLAGVLDRPPRERAPQVRREPADHPPLERRLERFNPRSETGAIEPAPDVPYRRAGLLEQEYAPYPDPHRKIPWTVIGVVAVAVILAILGLRYFEARMTSEPISLAVSERDGQLQIQWNHASNTIATATGGSLEITDGQEKQNVVLTPKELALGNFTYSRKTGDVRIRMLVAGSGGQIEEGSRFLGKEPEVADGNEMDLLKVQRDALQDEVIRLREQNSQQTERIQQLERTLTVMRTRMGISQSGR